MVKQPLYTLITPEIIKISAMKLHPYPTPQRENREMTAKCKGCEKLKSLSVKSSLNTSAYAQLERYYE